MLKALLAGCRWRGRRWDVVDRIADSYVDERVAGYRDARTSVDVFWDALQNMAQSVSAEADRPLLVMTVDEIERCWPSYTVEQ